MHICTLNIKRDERFSSTGDVIITPSKLPLWSHKMMTTQCVTANGLEKSTDGRRVRQHFRRRILRTKSKEKKSKSVFQLVFAENFIIKQMSMVNYDSLCFVALMINQQVNILTGFHNVWFFFEIYYEFYSRKNKYCRLFTKLLRS